MIWGVYLLTWDELARARGCVELVAAEPELHAIFSAQLRGPSSPLQPWLLAHAVNRALVERFGLWVSGWLWAASDGGLVRGGGQHCLRRGETPEAAAARVLAAVREWQSVIAELADEFEALRPAGARLVCWVLEKSDAHDAWYRSFATVLGWYLQAWALDDERAEAELERLVSGRFHSWVRPDAEQIRSTCAELGVALALRHEHERPDATLAWIAARRQTFPLAGVLARARGH